VSARQEQLAGPLREAIPQHERTSGLRQVAVRIVAAEPVLAAISATILLLARTRWSGRRPSSGRCRCSRGRS
jgi:hypothetical protein